MDWAQETIKELKEKHLVDDDATELFCQYYQDGETPDSGEAYHNSAISQEDFTQGNLYSLLIFEDGSCYADWKEGIDRFYSCLSDLTDEDMEVAERFKN